MAFVEQKSSETSLITCSENATVNARLEPMFGNPLQMQKLALRQMPGIWNRLQSAAVLNTVLELTVGV